MKALLKTLFLEDKRTYHPIVYLSSGSENLNGYDIFSNSGHRIDGYYDLKKAIYSMNSEFIPVFQRLGYELINEVDQIMNCKNISEIPQIQSR